jgi:hypothetical protein
LWGSVFWEETSNTNLAAHLGSLIRFMTMMNTQVKKRSAANDESNPLRLAGILQHVLAHVGPGHWYFISTVSKLWKDLYERVASQRTASDGYMEDGCFFMCVPKMTLCSSLFASPSRVRLQVAHDSGFHSSREQHLLDQFLAGVHADQETLVTAHELGLIQYSHHVLTGAARSGDLSKVMWLYTEQHCKRGRDLDLSMHAAMGGSIAVLDWLKQQGVTLTGYASDSAAEYGHMHVLQYLHAEGCEKGPNVCYLDAENGDLGMLKWAFEHDYSRGGNPVDESAAASSNTEMMAWLIQQPGVQLTAGTMAVAAWSGNLAMCELLHENECPWDEDSCITAAKCDSADMLRWLREHGCPCNIVQAADAAACMNRVAVLEYAAEQLIDLLNTAGVNGSLAAAQWLRQQGVEWPAVLRDNNGHKHWNGKTLAWARAEGCISPLN